MTKKRKSLWAAAAGVVAIVLVAGVYAYAPGRSAQSPGKAASDPVQAMDALSTPEGITLQALGKGQGWDLGKETASVIYRDQIAYADPRGITLYTYEQDPPGKSACVGECAAKFRPAAPLPDARPFGDWSVISREDGARQWAYKSKPLYTYIEDVDPGSLFGNSAARFGARRIDGAGNIVGGGRRGSGVRGATEDKPAPEGWQPALMHPAPDMLEVPPGFSVSEVLDAASIALVDHRGHTTYVFTGTSEDEKKGTLSAQRTPVAAPRMAFPQGEFATIERDDGVTQWSYKGKALYTYTDDLKIGDAYGVGQGWQVAAVRRHFVPEGVTQQRTASQGLVWANAEGMTLYKRDGHIYQSGGGHSLHRGQPQRPAVGRDIGVNAQCDAECSKVWSPFLAPEDAKPQGYWDVYTRADGKKQWAYQGYALWSYAGDKKPGDMLGHDIYSMQFAMDAKTRIDVGTPMDGIATLIWATAFP